MNKHWIYRAILTGLVLFSVGCGHQDDVVGPGVRERLQEGDAVVSVVLDASPTRRGPLQKKLRSIIEAAGSKVSREFHHVPGMNLVLKNEQSLERLLNHPRVVRVDLDIEGSGSLTESRKTIGIDATFETTASVTGAGRKVVVLDTGVWPDHPDLRDDIVDGACVCRSTVQGKSCCPSGTEGIASAFDDIGHGTHVSGIITSKGTHAPRGIAPDAQVVMVRVMNQNRFHSTGDIVAALEWVLENHPDADAVNMSLGTAATFSKDCDKGHNVPAYLQNLRAAVQNLRDAGVVVVASSGNDQSKSEMEAPACLSNVLSVGATYKYPSTKTLVPEFSNATSSLGIYAPGVSIVSTALGATSATKTGTSMAAPHVAAAVALVRSVGPNRSVSAVQNCLFQSPTSVTEIVKSVERTVPFLHVPSAVEACRDIPLPTNTEEPSESNPSDPEPSEPDPSEPPTSSPQNPVVDNATCNQHVTALPNGDMHFSLALDAPQKYVELFVQQNGVQNVAQDIAPSEVVREGKFIYSVTLPADQYRPGDVIRARFYHYAPGRPGRFTPGPAEDIWAPDFIYRQGPVCHSRPSCHPFVQELGGGELLFSVTYDAPKSYVEVFVEQNGIQDIARDITASATSRGDGDVTYSLRVPASHYRYGDTVFTRFYSYAFGSPGVFTPGPEAGAWSIPYVVDQSCP